MNNSINMAVGERPKIDWIAIDLIDVDHNYQREMDEKRVLKLLSHFHWSKFGSLILVAKHDGRFNCTDGQHRLEAAKLYPLISSVPAVVNPAADTITEAKSFLAINRDRKAVNTVEQYWAGLQAGDPDFIRLKNTLEEAGCEVAPAPGVIKPNITNAVTALIRATKSYGDSSVKNALLTIRKAWPDDPRALRGITVAALARLIRNNESMDHSRMAVLLSRKNQNDINGSAEAFRKISGGSAEVAISKTFIELYNKGMSVNTIQLGTG